MDTYAEKTNSVLAKIILAIILFIVIAGSIALIADGQTDGFGTVVIVIIAIWVVMD